MHCLVWLILIAFCSLACTKKRNHCIRKVYLHERRDCKRAITKSKAALKWIRILLTVACKVKDVCHWELVYHQLGIRNSIHVVFNRSRSGQKKSSYHLNFLLDIGNRQLIWSTGFAKDKHTQFFQRDRCEAFARFDKGSERWRVRGDNKIRCANLMVVLVDPSSMQRQQCKISRRTPVDAWPLSTSSTLPRI